MTATPLSAKSGSKPAGMAARKPGRPVVMEPNPGFFWRIFRRPEPSVFHRCLAIHMHNAAQPSALE